MSQQFKVLIINDDYNFRSMFKEDVEDFLKKEFDENGYVINAPDNCFTLEEIQKNIEEFKPDVILLDDKLKEWNVEWTGRDIVTNCKIPTSVVVLSTTNSFNPEVLDWYKQKNIPCVGERFQFHLLQATEEWKKQKVEFTMEVKHS